MTRTQTQGHSSWLEEQDHCLPMSMSIALEGERDRHYSVKLASGVRDKQKHKAHALTGGQIKSNMMFLKHSCQTKWTISVIHLHKTINVNTTQIQSVMIQLQFQNYFVVTVSVCINVFIRLISRNRGFSQHTVQWFSCYPLSDLGFTPLQ